MGPDNIALLFLATIQVIYWLRCTIVITKKIYKIYALVLHVLHHQITSYTHVCVRLSWINITLLLRVLNNACCPNVYAPWAANRSCCFCCCSPHVPASSSQSSSSTDTCSGPSSPEAMRRMDERKDDINAKALALWSKLQPLPLLDTARPRRCSCEELSGNEGLFDSSQVLSVLADDICSSPF